MSKNGQSGSVGKRHVQNLNRSEVVKNPPSIYRYISMGTILRNCTDDLVKEGKITKFLEAHIVQTYDIKMSGALRQIHMGVAEKILPLEFTAEKETNNTFIDGKWEIVLENVVLNPFKNPTRVNKMRILADNYTDKSADQCNTIKALLKSK